MPQDTTITVRIPYELKQRLQDVANETQRSLSKALILLLERGLEAYESDGLLLDLRKPVEIPKRKAK